MNSKSGRRRSKWIVPAILYSILAVTALAVLYPVLWIVSSALTPGNALSSSVWPRRATMRHFTELLNETQFLLWFKNTLFIATMTMLLSTVLIFLAAYSFSRFRFPGRRKGLMAMLVLQMFPNFMGMIAIYVLLLHVGLLDSHWGLILVYAGGSIPFGVWLVKGYFDGLPRSLEEAAKIDGASHSLIFFRIILPLSVPIVTFIAISHFIAPWMDFIFARLVIRSTDKTTVAIGLYNMITGRQNTQFASFAAGAVLISVPITILFLFLQRFIVDGLAAGANKG
ncbi:sugar ABC transporter permease [Paenibacillaceae bacterium WGS1546]|uniref:sugar ABC transporter permease n=1 Tax=Cohnella sp. WGS1546 TaxID=3366810 RepID=UPI00372D544C